MKFNGKPYIPNPDQPPRILRSVPEPPRFAPLDAPSRGTLHGPEESAEDYNVYNLLTLVSSDFGSITGQAFYRTVEIIGDHLWVAELSGPDAFYVRLGPKPNPFIRLRPNMVLARSYFRSLTFSINLSTVTELTRAIIYVSKGELIREDLGARYGVKNPNFFVQTVTTTTARLGTPLAFNRTLGKNGGTVTVYNNDLVNPIYIGWGVIGSVPGAGSGFPIEAGRYLTLPLDNSMERGANGLVIWTGAGTAEARIILSDSETDRFDLDQPIPVGIGQ